MPNDLTPDELRLRGEHLRALRRAAGLSKEALAEVLLPGNKHYRDFVADVEAGKSRVPERDVRDWASALGVHPEDLEPPAPL